MHNGSSPRGSPPPLHAATIGDAPAADAPEADKVTQV
jgi:hypothetical protein